MLKIFKSKKNGQDYFCYNKRAKNYYYPVIFYKKGMHYVSINLNLQNFLSFLNGLIHLPHLGPLSILTKSLKTNLSVLA